MKKTVFPSFAGKICAGTGPKDGGASGGTASGCEREHQGKVGGAPAKGRRDRGQADDSLLGGGAMIGRIAVPAVWGILCVPLDTSMDAANFAGPPKLSEPQGFGQRSTSGSFHSLLARFL